jgi:hypothetical protein
MPYSADNTPSYVPKAHKAQWAAVWNSAFKAHGDEGKAFKIANGVIKKVKAAETEELNDAESRIPAVTAQYMELVGAEKDSECNAVKVENGVSSKRGLCMQVFSPRADAETFSCGTCIHAVPRVDEEARLADVPEGGCKCEVQVPPIADSAIEASKGKPSPIGELYNAAMIAAAGREAGTTANLNPVTVVQERVTYAELSNRGQIKVELCGLANFGLMDGKQVQNLPIACTGTWFKDGHQFSITDNDLTEIVKNFNNRKNGMVEVDYEHASESPEVSRGAPVPAAGWIRRLSVCGGNLVASIEWTPEARGMLHTGAYRFFSPAIDWNYPNKETGESQGCTLTSGALTNHPFLEELPPIHLSEKILMDIGTVHVPKAMGDEPAAPVAACESEQAQGEDKNKVTPEVQNVVAAEAVTDAEQPVVKDTFSEPFTTGWEFPIVYGGHIEAEIGSTVNCDPSVSEMWTFPMQYASDGV